MGDKKKVAVRIQGKEYTIMCTEDEEYIQKLAYYVDRKLGEIINANSLLGADMASILTAINVADDLLKAMEVINKLRRKIPPQDIELQRYVDNFYNLQTEEFAKKEEQIVEEENPVDQST